MKLSDISKYMDGEWKSFRDMDIECIEIDSRRNVTNGIFICISGFATDGHSYAGAAAEKGAGALVVERYIDGIDIPQYKVSSSRKAFARLSSAWYGDPAKDLKLIGITGTKGKTTTAHMIKSLLEYSGKKTAVMGTIGTYIGAVKYDQNLTTPDPMEFHKLLKTIKDNRCTHVVMEVSAHALALDKLDGVKFEIGIFTNLSQDHLNDFKTMENYRDAKKKLFSNGYIKSAIVNADDENCDYMISGFSGPVIKYGINSVCDVRADHIDIDMKSIAYDMDAFGNTNQMRLGLPGLFNVYNSLAAASAALALSIDGKSIVKALGDMNRVEGRMEQIDCGQDYAVIVDYAHSPDSLYNILSAVKELKKNRILCVFGCGGDRDKTKRPIMGEISGRISDFTILTSDNPRTENPDSIIDMIEVGIKETGGEYIRISDRKQAIIESLSMARKDDIVIIAGKGHETYQDVMGVKHHFDDREVVREYLNRT